MNQTHQDPKPRRRPRRHVVIPLIVLGVFFIFLVFAVAMAVLLMSFRGPKPVKVSSRTVLVLNTGGEMPEYVPEMGLEQLLGGTRLTLTDHLNLIRKAARDSKVEGIFLRVEPLQMGWAQVTELRKALQAFKEQGKWIIAYGEIWSEPEYALALAADEIYAAPESFVFLDGLMSRVSFYGEVLAWAGVHVEVSAYKEYKNFADPYRYHEMSQAQREAMEMLLHGIEKELFETLVQARDVDMETVKQALQHGITRPQDAVDLHLMDGLAYLDTVEARIAEHLGVAQVDDVRFLDHDQYYRRPVSEDGWGSSEIALLYAVGGIQSGNGDRGLFGDAVVASDTFIENLRDAAQNPRVKAIVVRIDSPGGSALASDVIWRELQKIERVPVIASMGNVAASGGYYLAMGCDAIVANPSTITGSVGVVAMRLNFQQLYQNLMVHVDVVKTGERADFFDPYRALTDNERKAFHQRTEEMYVSFVQKAASCRKMTFEDFEPFARGRIWTGAQAKERGLVDLLGGLRDALELAAERAGLSDYHVRVFPPKKDFWELMREGRWTRSEVPAWLQQALSPAQRSFLDCLSQTGSKTQFCAMIPFVVDVR